MKISIFDLDYTILKINSSFKYYLFLYKKNFFKKSSFFYLFFYFLRLKLFNFPLKKLHKIIFEKYLKGMDKKILIDHVNAFLDKYLYKSFYMPCINKINEASLNNHYLVLLSSSPDFLVKPISRILKFNECHATVYGVDKDNKFDKIESIIDGDEKERIAKNIIKKLAVYPSDIYVYSDSIDDLKLFYLAEHKIAVRPNRKLLKVFKKNKWEII